jgi:hypothetical protein
MASIVSVALVVRSLDSIHEILFNPYWQHCKSKIVSAAIAHIGPSICHEIKKLGIIAVTKTYITLCGIGKEF